MRAKFGRDPTAGSKILSFKFISRSMIVGGNFSNYPNHILRPGHKEALYRIWCGVNRLGDSGVNDSAILQLLLTRRVSYCLPAGVRPEWMASA